VSGSQIAGFLNGSRDMFDVAKRREPVAEKREETRDLYQENDFSLDSGSIGKFRRGMVGYRR
jgi:hypothetical protein